MKKKTDFYSVVIIFLLSLFALSVASTDRWNAVDRFSYDLMKDANFIVHDTKPFRYQSGLHVRHNLDGHLAFQCQGQYDDSFDRQFTLIENDNKVIYTWLQRPKIQEGALYFDLHVNESIPVGQYTLNVSNPCNKESHNMFHLCTVNVMFNPRSFHSSERVRRQETNNDLADEYINNDNGYIWIWSTAIPWNYAVSSQVVTDSKNKLTQMMSETERSNKVLYSRALTRLIGNNVLHGRWNGNYHGGVDPTQWVGSKDILERWLQSGRRVRYAQCWVFAAILTTILRASGIPARTVTNYNSHHDRGLTDDGTAVLRQYDNIIQEDEATWNFHVWSEAWLERPDLGEPADWNAVDATPQEPSPLDPSAPYQAGPAYVPYIQSDMRSADYDTYFILAEVNARKYCNVTRKLLPTDTGYEVVTKLPGKQRDTYNYNKPEVITNSYKIPSESKRASDSITPVLPPPYTGCERDEGLRIASTPISPRVGDNFVITITEGNVSLADIVIRMELMNYMGESLGIIDTFTGLRELNVTESDYSSYLGNSSIFRFTVGEYHNESESEFLFHDAIRIRLEYNPLEVEAMKDTNSSDGTITLILTYTNPLSIPMTGVIMNIASPNNAYLRMEQPDIPARSFFVSNISVDCGDNEDNDIMIPISLDSEVTQSVYGTGWSSCRKEQPPTDGGFRLSEISVLQVIFVILLASLCLY